MTTRTANRDWRLRYEPMRPTPGGYGYTMRLDLQRRSSDGEWETVDSAPFVTDTVSMFSIPDAFSGLERSLAAPHGLDHRGLAVLDSPCARLFGGGR